MQIARTLHSSALVMMNEAPRGALVSRVNERELREFRSLPNSRAFGK